MSIWGQCRGFKSSWMTPIVITKVRQHRCLTQIVIIKEVMKLLVRFRQWFATASASQSIPWPEIWFFILAEFAHHTLYQYRKKCSNLIKCDKLRKIGPLWILLDYHSKSTLSRTKKEWRFTQKFFLIWSAENAPFTGMGMQATINKINSESKHLVWHFRSSS